MPVYLIEHQVGYDGARLGFPGLGSCMAVALVTTRGLYGFHFTPAPIAQAGQFAQYITANRQPGENDLRLYGSCYWAKRYDGGSSSQWRTEMTAIANAINFHGPVRGYDTSSWISRTDPNDTTYLEYRKSGQKCKIFYKKSAKMNIVSPVQPPDPVIKRVKETGPWSGVFTMVNPTETKNIQTAGVIRTPGNKGDMHEVGMFGKHSFDIP